MKTPILSFFLGILIICGTVSCGPSSKAANRRSAKLKSMTYLADSVTDAERLVSKDFKLLLQPGDRISILVTALNPEAAQQFNVLTATTLSINADASKSAGSAGGTGSASTPASPVVSDYGYLVDGDGNIQFPELGNVQVRGLTLSEVADKIKKQLLQYLKEPTVIVNLINFRVNVLGEVNHPGTITVTDGKITIIQAISEASDLTIFGKRENILVVREENGKREFGRVDLTSNKIFNSPFFYLKQGDIVYVELNRNKLILSDANGERNFRIISIILGAITAAAISVNALRR
jgi:polysaccharide export outer membrane protein